MKKVIILMIISLNLFSKEILRDFTTLKLKNGIYYNNVDGEKFTGEVIYSKDGYEYDVNYVKGIKEGKSTEKYLKDNYLYRESFYIKGILTSYKIYFKNGNTREEAISKDNTMNVKIFSEKMNLIENKNYVFRDGEWVFSGEQYVYSEDGSILKLRNYDLKNNLEYRVDYYKNNIKKSESCYVIGSSIKEGMFATYDKGGFLIEKSYYKDNSLNGIEEIYENKKIISQTKYKNNQKDGVEKKYIDGIISIESNYILDEKDGVEKVYNKDGEVEYTIFYKKGNIEKVLYKNKELTKDEKIIIKDFSGKKHLEFTLKNLKLNGEVIEYKDDKKYKKSKYLQGKKEGEEITYLGKLEWIKTPYKNGVIEGTKVINFSNTERTYMTFEYINGIQTGIQVINYTRIVDGVVFINEVYNNVDGLHEGEYKKYYPKTKGLWMFAKRIVEETGNYVKDKREGLFIRYDEKGRIESEVIYKNGLKDGVEKNYKKNILIKETTYSKGLKNGIEKNYDKKGKLVSQIDYKDNKIVKVTTYKNGEIIKVSDKEEME